jgi:hypothetical protein
MTMIVDCSELRQLVPIRPRVAFVLAVAERVLPALAKNAEAFNVAQQALANAWRWAEGQSISALQLYEDDAAALAVQGSLIKDKEASAAICAVTSAFYYFLWNAFRQQLKEGLVSEGAVPNDMAEVTEEVMEEVCDFAAQTSLCDTHWLTSLAKRLSTDFRAANPEELGPVVARQYVK